MKRLNLLLLLSLSTFFMTLLGGEISILRASEPIPENWLSEWENPSALMRPLQIVHGRDLTDPATSVYFRDECGLGGVVFNVGGDDYIRNQENWDRFVAGAKQADAAGLRLWIYDEQGYPSLEAGGVVLEGHPELVSQELVWDKDNAAEPFQIRECYEYTHSCNNYAAARKYPNPLDAAADARFVEVTHARYKAELGDELYNKVEAFFTDEPSMMAANLGQIPEEVRKNVRIDDPLDPNKKNLPMLPWCGDLEEQYKVRYGEELRPHFLSLFTGDTEQDKKIRARYWKLIEDLYADRFYGTIARWCAKNGGPVSSGHTLREENLNAHVPLDGNKMRTLKSLDIPGLDMLSSDPQTCQFGGWMAAGFPCSAAQIIGQRRTMTEISDFAQTMGGDRKQVHLDMMQAAAAWQAAWGVTDFALYYSIRGSENEEYRNEASHKAYCEFVGRLNAVLFDAKPVRPLLLYYPAQTLQREFLPIAGSVDEGPLSETAQQTIRSFTAIGQELSRAAVPFTIIDADSILELPAYRLNQFSAVVFPAQSNPPQEVLDKLTAVWQVSADSDRLIQAENGDQETSVQAAKTASAKSGPRLAVEPATDSLTQGVFERDGRLVFVLTNVQKETYSGSAQLFIPSAGFGANRSYGTQGWSVLNPQTGEAASLTVAEADGTVTFPLELAARETVLVIAPEYFTPTGEITLFNGENLDGWQVYLSGQKPGEDANQVFTVHDGVIHISGNGFGGITTDNAFTEYQLSVEFKWGEKTWAGKAKMARDSGILIHSYGPDGGFGPWRKSVEANVVEGGLGDFWMVSNTEDGLAATCDVVEKNGTRIYSPDEGKPVTITANSERLFGWSGRDPDWKDETGFRGKNDLDKPGDWNEITINAKGDGMEIFVNGTKVNYIYGLKRTNGSIQLQTEGAELYYRNIKIRPLE